MISELLILSPKNSIRPSISVATTLNPLPYASTAISPKPSKYDGKIKISFSRIISPR